jgi:hypothetical protein
MNPDTSIQRSFQMPNMMASIAQGAQAGQFVNEARHQNALRGAIQQHGAGLVSGDPTARNALAGFDPMMVQQADANRQSLAQGEQAMKMAYQQAGLKAQEFAANLSAQQRQQARQEFEQGANMIAAAQTPEQFAQIAQIPGIAEAVEAFVGPGMFSFENRQIIAAAAMGAKDALALTSGPGPQSPEGKFFADQRAGLVPADAQPRAGVTVNTGDQGPRTGTIPPGFMLIEDQAATGGMRMVPIPGGPAEQEAAQTEGKAANRQAQTERFGEVVFEDIGRVRSALENSKLPIAGAVGGLLSNIPGTSAYDASQLLMTIQANVGFDRLQQMREASPTGGALGAVSDFENRQLQATLGNLSQSQSQSQFLRNLERLEDIYTTTIHGPPPSDMSMNQWKRVAWGQGGQSSATGQQMTPQAILQMPLPDLVAIDVMSLDGPALDAFERRMQEIGR